MSIARPAAEIDPQASIFSSNWILPGPIRASPSRSIRTLREGSDLALDFGMDDLLSLDRAARLPPKPFTNKLKRLHIRINTGFWK